MVPVESVTLEGWYEKKLRERRQSRVETIESREPTIENQESKSQGVETGRRDQ